MISGHYLEVNPGDAIGRYQLLSRLGAGGMKEVWRARDLAAHGEVALALVFQFDRERFINEVALARRVDSPHVARVLDGFITDHGLGVVVNELCDGLDLMHYRQARDVSPGEAVALIAQMASGLVAIHRAHVLHRDVKPSNAILTADGVKIIDFGVSLPAVDSRTGAGESVPPAGTLPYLAPESVHGNIDARLDTYALGVSLFELVAGRLPLPDLGAHSWLARIVAAEPLPADVLDLIDLRIAAMFERMCQPDRERRPYLLELEPELHALAATLGGLVPTAIGLPAAATLVPVAAAAAAPAAAAAFGPIPITIFPDRLLRIPIALPEPGRIVIGWPHLPLLALVPDAGGTRIRGFDPAGLERWSLEVADDLRGGLVADLDGDGVGELYAWSATRVHVIDAASRVRLCIDIPPRRGTMPWDHGALAPVVLESGHGRELAAGGSVLDPVTRAVTPLAGGWQGQGAELVDALGFTGLSCHGAARQRFRGDVGTPAAILVRRRQPEFVVASLERVFDGRPTVALGLWGPGGTRVGGGEVGHYALQTAPLEMYQEAQSPTHSLFADHVAPLALVGSQPSDDVIVVPYLHNAPWFGPLLVAFDGTGAERWRERLPRALQGPVPAPPMLVDLDGDGRPQLLWAEHDGQIHRRDARTGAMLAPPHSAQGAPVAALDLGGRGEVHLITWRADAIVATRHGRCLPGAILWLPTRGDLWRSGTLGPDGFPVGPRA